MADRARRCRTMACPSTFLFHYINCNHPVHCFVFPITEIHHHHHYYYDYYVFTGKIGIQVVISSFCVHYYNRLIDS